MSQPEAGVLGLRENRARDFGGRKAPGALGRPNPRVGTRGVGGNAVRSAISGGCENTNSNMDICTNGRRSPRLGACSAKNNVSRVVHPSARVGIGGALADITNVAGSLGLQSDKAKISKPQQHPLQPAVPKQSGVVPPPQVVDMLVDVPGTCDASEMTNVQNVDEYVDEIVNQFFDDENAFLPRADYMSSQTDITSKMRTILIDWLVEVHMKYRLRPETLHLAVNLIDRYLTKTPVMRKRLQLVGVVAMFIAAKYEEISPPELHDWVYITDNAYTKEDILVMECTMLTTLRFQIMVPTAANFFEYLQKVNGCDAVHRNVAEYLLELGLLDMRMLQHTPSQQVAAALLLSNKLLKRSIVWPAAMAEQSRHTEQALRSCAEEMQQLLEADRAGAGGQLQAVNKKFSLVQRQAVAKMKF